jgi:hypothetical protein
MIPRTRTRRSGSRGVMPKNPSGRRPTDDGQTAARIDGAQAVMTDIMQRAIHESGHAVVALARGLALRRCSLRVRGTSGGECRLAQPYRDEKVRDVRNTDPPEP